MTGRFARIAITLPPEDLASADELAQRLDRSRSWVVAEAIRHYAAAVLRDQSRSLDASRLAQIGRDLALTPEERVRAAEELLAVPAVRSDAPEPPLTFATYDDFRAWRRDRAHP